MNFSFLTGKNDQNQDSTLLRSTSFCFRIISTIEWKQEKRILSTKTEIYKYVSNEFDILFCLEASTPYIHFFLTI